MLSIPADAPPGELAGFAGILLFERPFDAPIVRQVHETPLAVIEFILREGNLAAGIALGPGLGRGFGIGGRGGAGLGAQAVNEFLFTSGLLIGGEGGACGLDPVLDGRIVQLARGLRRVALDKAPAGIEGEALGRSNGLGRDRESGEEERQQGRPRTKETERVGEIHFAQWRSHAEVVSPQAGWCPLGILAG